MDGQRSIAQVAESGQVENGLPGPERDLHVLLECHRLVARAGEELDLMQRFCELVTSEKAGRSAWIGLVEQDEGRMIRPVARAGCGAECFEQKPICWDDNESGSHPAAVAVRTLRPIFWRENGTAPEGGFASTLALPLICDEQPFAALAIDAAAPDAFNAGEAEHLMELADILAHGIGNLRARDKQKRLEKQLLRLQRMDALGQLAGGVAHDFNNTLQAILGYATMAQRSLSPGEQCFCDLKCIQDIATKAAVLTRQLLYFSRRQTGICSDIDLNRSINDLLKMMERIIGSNIELEFVPGRHLRMVHVDPGQIDQALMNLCINARDAMTKGGRLTIKAENFVFSESYCRSHPWAKQGRYVLLSVIDTGCGMTEEMRARIFEPFYTTKPDGLGTGLGLSMVRSVVHRHSGFIRVDSEPGQGSTFRIYLPAVERMADFTPEKVEKTVVGGSETILIAEDSGSVRDTLIDILKDAGYTVLGADNGADAVRLFQENAGRISIVLLDLIMPKLSGLEVFKRIRALEPQMPFLFISGYKVTDGDLLSASRAEIVYKPCEYDVLLCKIRKLLRKN